MDGILLGCLAATIITASITAFLYVRARRVVRHKEVWFLATLLSGAFCFFCASSSALIFVANLP